MYKIVYNSLSMSVKTVCMCNYIQKCSNYHLLMYINILNHFQSLNEYSLQFNVHLFPANLPFQRKPINVNFQTVN